MISRILTIFFICVATTTLAQNKRNYLVGIEAWGGYSRGSQTDTTGFTSKNSGSFIDVKLYGGKFISNSLALYGCFNFGTSKNKTDYSYANGDKVTYNNKGNTLSFGIGARKHYGFSESNIIGLLVNAEVLYSILKAKDIYQRTYNNVFNEEVSENKIKSVDVSLGPGVYINFNKNWQLFLKLGGAYYKYSWRDEVVNASGKTLRPNSSLMNISFNVERFSLSVVRFL